MGSHIPRRLNALLVGTNPALTLKVLYCLYPFARVDLLHSGAAKDVARSRHVTRAHHIEFARDDFISALNTLVGAREIDVIVPADLGASAFLHTRRGRIEGAAMTPTASHESLSEIHNKWSFAERLMAAGLPSPKTVLLKTREELTPERAADVGFPLMIKPLECESSHGVRRFDDYEGLAAYVARPQRYNEPPLILQSFIAGEDVDISVIAEDGHVIVSACQTWTPQGTLYFEDDPEMEQLAADIVALFKFNGPAHFDMRRGRSTGELYVLECNPRFWYTLPAAKWAGLNFVEAAVLKALGRPIDGLGPASGHYRLPGDVVRAWRRPTRLAAMSLANWQGFLQPVLDPAPHLSQLVAN